MRLSKMMVVAGALTVLCGSAWADPVNHIGNTLIIKRTTGTGKLFYHANHTFTLHAIGGELIHGKWAVNDGKLCHLDMDSKSLAPFCVREDLSHKVGDSWDVKSPDGIPETLTLVAGQEALKTPPVK